MVSRGSGNWLFPRREKILGHRKDTSIVGRVVFAKKQENRRPIHHLKCELWVRSWWFSWRKLGEGITNMEGQFSVPFDLRTSRRMTNRKNLRFEIYQTTHIYYRDGKPHPHFELFKTIKIPKADMIGMRYNLHDIQLFFWEYRDDTPVPRVVFKEDGTDPPQKYVQGRLDAFYQQVIPLELTKLKHLDQIKYAPDTIDMRSMNEDYPLNLTRCIEKELPGYTRSDEWLGQRMMNGMNMGYFQPDPDNEHHYWIKYFGVCWYPHNDEFALPTVKVKFEVKGDQLPKPIEIRLIGPLNAFNKDPWQERVITPDQKDEWLYAKRVVRVSGAYTTEVDEHFTGTHLNTEQFAVAAYRNLRLNPIATLLLPHLKEVVLVNHSADSFLLKDFIPMVSALTPEGLQERTKDVLGFQDWKNWRPRTSLGPQHTCAQAEDLFWNIIRDFTSEFIDDNLSEIVHYWHEIYAFSEDLVEHAVPVFLSDKDLDSMGREERLEAEERLRYNAEQYGFDLSAQREIRKGILRAVSPITLKTSIDPQKDLEDIRNLKQACAYMIMIATYMHTWINEHQYDQLGEVLYSCGGLRFGEKERGILAPESDMSISPDLSRATQGLWLANILSRTEYGFITTDNEKDVHPRLIEMLKEKEKAFEALHVNIHEIESRTNI
ncbi:MAG: hypothetical protein LPK79_14235 [Bacteroidota bacterium]|nr:hypothetical protein [Bacteroidota bacterium]